MWYYFLCQGFLALKFCHSISVITFFFSLVQSYYFLLLFFVYGPIIVCVFLCCRISEWSFNKNIMVFISFGKWANSGVFKIFCRQPRKNLWKSHDPPKISETLISLFQSNCGFGCTNMWSFSLKSLGLLDHLKFYQFQV